MLIKGEFLQTRLNRVSLRMTRQTKIMINVISLRKKKLKIIINIIVNANTSVIGKIIIVVKVVKITLRFDGNKRC